MDDWRRRMPTPHLTTAMPHYHGLDFGRTMPLRHPPATAHGRGAFDTSPQSFIPFSHPLAPIPIPMASRELPIAPSSSLASPQIPASSTDSSRQQNVEKKRWQTANFRWMFTKRKGKRWFKCRSRTLWERIWFLHAVKPLLAMDTILTVVTQLVYRHVSTSLHISLYV